MTASHPNHLPNERVVAFIDILGFCDLVHKMRDDSELYEIIRVTLDRISESSKQWRDREIEYQNLRSTTPVITHFSDSIVISCEVDSDHPKLACYTVCHSALDYACLNLTNDILVRGGISMGWAYHKGGTLFGEAVNRAYELERNCASVPRIILSDDVYEQVCADNSSMFRKDSDGFHYLNVLARLIRGSYQEPTDGFDRIKAVGKYLELYLKGIDADDFNILAKFRWYANYYNDVVENLQLSAADKNELIIT